MMKADRPDTWHAGNPANPSAAMATITAFHLYYTTPGWGGLLLLALPSLQMHLDGPCMQTPTCNRQSLVLRLLPQPSFQMKQGKWTWNMSS